MSATKSATSAKSAKPAKATASKSPKEGGNIMQDIQKLAIPFAILAAKKGLDVAVEKTKNTTKTTNASKTGGSKKKMVRGEMDKLSNEIEKYLNKY